MENNLDHLSLVIYKIFPILYLLIGITTNLLSILVYSKKHMRKTPYSLYLLELAVVDLIVIITGNTRYVLIGYFNIDIREQSIILCKIHKFLTYFFLQFSSCLLTMLSIDRFFGVVLALKAFTFNKKSLAHRISIIIIIFLLFVNMHMLVWYGYEATVYDKNHNSTINTTIICDLHPNKIIYERFWHFFFYIDGSIYCLLPFFVMTTCNIFIIIRTIKSRVKSKAIMRHTVKKTNRTVLPKSISASSISANEQRIIILLLVMSVGFLIFTIPISIVEFLDHYDTNFQANKYRKFLQALTEMIMYTNHVINFFFYFFFGPNFRKEIVKQFKHFFSCFLNNKTKRLPSKFSRYNTVFAASSMAILNNRRYGIGGEIMRENDKIIINIYENRNDDENVNSNQYQNIYYMNLNKNSFKSLTKKISDHISVLYRIDLDSKLSSDKYKSNNIKRNNTCLSNISIAHSNV